MKQAVLIPWDVIDALTQTHDPKFYTWLGTVDAPIVLMPKRPESMTPEIHKKTTHTVQLGIYGSEKKPGLKPEGFVHFPDFEINIELEHVVELLSDLEQERCKCGFEPDLQGKVSLLQRHQRVVVEPYYDKLKAYLEPFAEPDKDVEINKDILIAERNRYIAASVLNQYELALVRKKA